MKQNLLITGECYTHRPEYFSTTFFIPGFVPQHFRGFERLLHRQIQKCSSISILLKLCNTIINIIKHTRLTLSFYRAVFKIFEKSLKIQNCSKFIMEAMLRKILILEIDKHKPTKLSCLQNKTSRHILASLGDISSK